MRRDRDRGDHDHESAAVAQVALAISRAARSVTGGQTIAIGRRITIIVVVAVVAVNATATDAVLTDDETAPHPVRLAGFDPRLGLIIPRRPRQQQLRRVP